MCVCVCECVFVCAAPPPEEPAVAPGYSYVALSFLSLIHQSVCRQPGFGALEEGGGGVLSVSKLFASLKTFRRSNVWVRFS